MTTNVAYHGSRLMTTLPASNDTSNRLPVLNPCFTPDFDLVGDTRVPTQVVRHLTEDELDENFLFLDPSSLGSNEYLVGGLLQIPYRQIVTLVSDGGVGKSLLAADLALRVAAGLPFLGQTTKRGTVIYLDFEQDRGTMRRRLDKLALEAGVPLPELYGSFHYSNFTSKGTSLLEVREELISRVEGIKPDLIVIDSWAAAMQFDSNEESAVNEAFGFLKKLLHWGTVFILAHTPDRGARLPANQLKPSGHRQQRQQPRLIFGLTGKPNDNRLKLGISKTNEPVERTIFEIERMDTLNGEGLKHVLLQDKDGQLEKEGRAYSPVRLPRHLELVKETVKDRQRIERAEMLEVLIQNGFSESSADKHLRERGLSAISDWVRAETDESDSRKKWLVWKPRVVLQIA